MAVATASPTPTTSSGSPTRVDIENYLTYVAMEMLVANTDTGNIKFYRVPGGKWKWIFYDLDWASFDMSYNYVQRYLNDEGHGVSRAFSNRLIMGLLENDSVRDQFLTILADLMKGNFSNQNIRAKVEEYKALLEPEMAGQFEKWGGSFESWEKYINTIPEQHNRAQKDVPGGPAGVLRAQRRADDRVLRRGGHELMHRPEWLRQSGYALLAGQSPTVADMRY